MRSPRRELIEQCWRLASPEERFVSMGARIRVYRRGTDGTAHPAELLPGIHGGLYDRDAARYIGPPRPESIVELKIHPGQIRFFQHLDDPGVYRVLGLGSPGSGKTEGILAVTGVQCLWWPNKIGGVVAPTRARLKVAWRKFINLAGPKGWIAKDGIKPGDSEIHLANGVIVQFVSAKRQSDAVGSPIAGLDWWFAVEDEQQHIDTESLQEVDARMRNNPAARIYSSATNENIHAFQLRIREYETASDTRVVRFNGFENAFTPLEHWERLRGRWGKDEFNRRIMCLDVPQDGRVYPEFSYEHSIRPAPLVKTDVTADVTRAKWERPYEYIVGCDPGHATSVSIVLKCWRGEQAGELLWYAWDEITTRDKVGIDWHIQDLLRYFGGKAERFIVLADPNASHGEGAGKETDETDYAAFRRAGIAVKKANWKPIPQKHRFAMVNALLQDAAGKRRLYLASNEDSPGKPRCHELAESLAHLLYGPDGKPQSNRKGSVGKDLTHWADALGYGLFHFERLRGADLKAAEPKARRDLFDEELT